MNNIGNHIKNALAEYDSYRTLNIIPKEYNDINVFEHFNAFFNFMKDNSGKFGKIKQDKEDEKLLKKSAKILYRDSKHLLVSPLSHQASCKYGANTKWCTTSSSSTHYYDSYTSAGTLYIHRFFNENGAFVNEAYQLFIPDGTSSSYNEIELNDQANRTMDDLDDFLEGIPDGVADVIRQEVEDAGGFNGGDSFISGSGWAETENDVLKATWSYSLMKERHGEWDTEDDGDDTTYSSFKIMKVGKNTEIPDEAQTAYEVDDQFVLDNGNGIYVQMNGAVRPDDASNNATHKWHEADNNNMEVEDYEINNNIKDLLGEGEKYDYIIINHKDGLDYLIRNILDDYFDFYTPYDPVERQREISHDTMEILVNETVYSIYYQLNYNYRTLENPPVSSKVQRRLDRQQELPYGL